MEFGPDGAFATDLRDDERALAFLQQHNLDEGQYLCCIPRLRYTPYWTIPEKKVAHAIAAQARQRVRQRQRETMETLQRALTV